MERVKCKKNFDRLFISGKYYDVILIDIDKSLIKIETESSGGYWMSAYKISFKFQFSYLYDIFYTEQELRKFKINELLSDI